MNNFACVGVMFYQRKELHTVNFKALGLERGVLYILVYLMQYDTFLIIDQTVV